MLPVKEWSLGQKRRRRVLEGRVQLQVGPGARFDKAAGASLVGRTSCRSGRTGVFLLCPEPLTSVPALRVQGPVRGEGTTQAWLPSAGHDTLQPLGQPGPSRPWAPPHLPHLPAGGRGGRAARPGHHRPLPGAAQQGRGHTTYLLPPAPQPQPWHGEQGPGLGAEARAAGRAGHGAQRAS